MPARKKRQYDRGAREDALLIAATEVFSDVGYEAATTRRVAEVAGCSEGLIHRYFGSKAGLLRRLLESRAAPRGREIAGEPPIGTSLEKDLRRLMVEEVEALHRERAFVRIAIGRALVDPQVAKIVDGGVQRARVAAFAQRLEAHREAGRIRRGADLEAAALTLASAGFVLGFLRRGVFGHPKARVGKEASNIANLVARSIKS